MNPDPITRNVPLAKSLLQELARCNRVTVRQVALCLAEKARQEVSDERKRTLTVLTLKVAADELERCGAVKLEEGN